MTDEDLRYQLRALDTKAAKVLGSINGLKTNAKHMRDRIDTLEEHRLPAGRFERMETLVLLQSVGLWCLVATLLMGWAAK